MSKSELYEQIFKYRQAYKKDMFENHSCFLLKYEGENLFVTLETHDNGPADINILIGDDSFLQYVNFYHHEPDSIESFEAMHGCQRILVQLLDKDDLSFQELDEVKQYAKALNYRLTGKNRYPYFVYHDWMRLPVDLNENQIKIAIFVLKYMNTYLHEINYFAVEFFDYFEQDEVTFIYLNNPDEEYHLEITDPTSSFDVIPYEYSKVEELDDAKYPTILECQLIALNEPAQDRVDEVPYFPFYLLVTEKNTGILKTTMIKDYYEAFQRKELLNSLVDELVEESLYPLSFMCKDLRTMKIIEPLVELLDVDCYVASPLVHLDDALDYIIGQFGRKDGDLLDEISSQLVGFLNSVYSNNPDLFYSTLNDMPEEIKDHSIDLAKNNAFNKEVNDAILSYFEVKFN